MPQPDKIMDLTTPTEAELPTDLDAYWEKCRTKLGFIPNVLRAWALRPQKLRNFMQTYNELMLGESGLSKLEREMIAVVVSAVNRCYYCLVAHGAAVRQLSGDPQLGEMLAFNYRVAPLPERQRAMLDYAVLLTEAPEHASEEQREHLRELGFTDADIFDICEVTGFYNMTNRVAHGVDMMPNAEYHSQAR